MIDCDASDGQIIVVIELKNISSPSDLHRTQNDLFSHNCLFVWMIYSVSVFLGVNIKSVAIIGTKIFSVSVLQVLDFV